MEEGNKDIKIEHGDDTDEMGSVDDDDEE